MFSLLSRNGDMEIYILRIVRNYSGDSQAPSVSDILGYV